MSERKNPLEIEKLHLSLSLSLSLSPILSHSFSPPPERLVAPTSDAVLFFLNRARRRSNSNDIAKDVRAEQRWDTPRGFSRKIGYLNEREQKSATREGCETENG